MATDKTPLENPAVLQADRTQDVTLCPRCDEALVFGMKDKYHEFSIGLSTVLECLVIAEHNGFVPKLPDGWWSAVGNRSPVFPLMHHLAQTK